MIYLVSVTGGDFFSLGYRQGQFLSAYCIIKPGSLVLRRIKVIYELTCSKNQLLLKVHFFFVFVFVFLLFFLLRLME